MTELSTEIAPAADIDAPTDSTAVSAAPANDQGSQHKAGSKDDAIERAMNEAGVQDDDAPVEKPEPEAKDEPAAKEPEAKDEPEAKPEPVKEEKPAEEPKPKAEPKGKHPEAPANFIPRAKDLWINVPNEVKGEVARMASEHEAEIGRYRDAFQPLARYDQMAREHGTTIHDALERYTSMETALRENPTEGVRGLIKNMGMQPHHMIGHVMQAFGVTPQALAQHLAQNPEVYFQKQQPQAPKPDPQIAQLQQQLAAARVQNADQSIVQPFAAANPRFAELQSDIANFLKSDMVPRNLPPQQRLEVAYDLAERINPISRQQAPASSEIAPAEVEASSRAGQTFGGNKSVKGAPTGGVNTARSRKGISKDDAISLALAEIGYN